MAGVKAGTARVCLPHTWPASASSELLSLSASVLLDTQPLGRVRLGFSAQPCPAGWLSLLAGLLTIASGQGSPGATSYPRDPARQVG